MGPACCCQTVSLCVELMPNCHEHGSLVNPSQLSQQEFIDNFEDSWAEALLPSHPEYLLLLNYEKLSASHTWDEAFEATDTYQDALAKGYLNLTANSVT